MTRSRVASNGTKSIYLEHGIFYDVQTKNIHVTAPGLHLSYKKGEKPYEFYKIMLQRHDRWPEGVE